MHRPRLAEKARAWLPVLPLLLLLAATYWLDLQVQPQPKTGGQQRHDVDYVIDNFSAITLSEEGRPRFTLSAEKLWHYPDDDTTHLQMPLLTNLYPDRPPTRTSAQSGMVSSKGDEVFLFDQVRILRPAFGDASEQLFSTNYLHVIPDSDWADTDQPVVVTDQYNILRAVGMELDNKARTVKLLSRVRATHEPIPD
ncbi:MAG: LPS export ABC transporter periplasmic protein LptC [Nitrosomonadales bacterium]|nr:LPS export ABC transporter periplasmic protein LptC [Nitrosomonadales bacterium]